MTLVVSGYALPRVDGYSAPSIFGFTLNTAAPGPITVAQAENSSIEQWYVVDLRIKRRRPITRQEWQLLRQFIEVAKRSRKKYVADLKQNKAAEALFAATFGGRINDSEGRGERGIRIPFGDPSGLRPVIRATSDRKTRARGSTRALRKRPGTRGRH